MKTSSARKRELREQYKLMRPDMGIFAVICKPNSRYYLETTENLKGAMNSTEFKLNAGMHPKKALQKDWSEFGSEEFEIRILEQIEPDDMDESRAGYEDDLALLKIVWIERLTGENIELY
ncbi:MAG: GIY-YIG nuclease family protein [Bacillota bacterium]